MAIYGLPEKISLIVFRGTGGIHEKTINDSCNITVSFVHRR